MNSPKSILGQIQDQLVTIESRESVQVLYACESGSRAWGFASKDSDFDVRFIYLRPTEWYVSVDLEAKRDVIELPLANALDINGWDLRKALRLLQRSNPPLLEWLGSPTVYLEQGPIAGEMRTLAREFYCPVSCAHHYLHMAQRNFREYLRGPDVWRKKYLYVLRPLLAVRWIESDLGLVPTEFSRLVERLVQDSKLRLAIDGLLDEKRRGSELDRGPRIEPISAFIEEQLARFDENPLPSRPEMPPTEPFNRVFREALLPKPMKTGV
ncbi:MAG TPA: nucleotidyltransferase domain-containing protein [Terriglobia bacterium]|nr:nucleotidyltransferase domain-containing protein [Terriglobia bacterium]